MIILPTVRAAIGGFSPMSLSPAFWLSDTGSDASVWPDISGNGLNANQSDSTKRPSIVSNVINGKQVRRFDGINDYLTVACNIPQPLTVFLVLKETATGRWFFDGGTSGARCLIGDGLAGQPNKLGISASASVVEYARTVSGSPFAVIAAEFNSATSKIFENGTQKATGNAGTQGLTGGATVGAGYNFSSSNNGDIAEVMVFSSVLSSDNRLRLERYLGNKYGITVA